MSLITKLKLTLLRNVEVSIIIIENHFLQEKA